MKDNLKIDCYGTIIFDFDGVILDSNNVKKDAIGKAVECALDRGKSEEFVRYFVHHNGVPRREKVEKFVPKELVETVLEQYEVLLDQALFEATLIPGVRDFIEILSKHPKNPPLLYVLSGGEVGEIDRLLEYHDLAQYFDGVYAAPYRKEKNLNRMKLKPPILFFGDSLIDFEVARESCVDFVFVYGASNVLNWREEVDQDDTIAIIEDFMRVIKC